MRRSNEVNEEGMIVAEAEERLRLGDSGFVKSRLKRLLRLNVTWDVEFRALMKAVTQLSEYERR